MNAQTPISTEDYASAQLHDVASRPDMRALQAPLRADYERHPEHATVTDYARTCSRQIPADQPLYGMLTFKDPANTQFPIALHTGVGGRGELPVPGDILCAAVASCLDSTIRVIANFLSVSISELTVEVEADADLRGTLRMSNDVPVAFSDLRIYVTMIPRGDVPPDTITAILNAAEASCVVLQTLRNPPRISVSHQSNA